MARSLAIFGTPDGFDSYAFGDAALASSDIIRKFEALSFTSLDVPLGTAAWGVFKRTDSDGTIIGVGKLIRAQEFSEVRPGGYVGSGFVFRNQVAPALDLVIAIQELTDAVVASAFGERPFRFVASKLSDLPRTEIPESCKALSERLVESRAPNPLADASITRLYIKGDRTEILRTLLSEHEKFSTINVLFSEDYDLSAPAAAGGLTVASLSDFEEWTISAEIGIRTREQVARQKAADEAARARQASVVPSLGRHETIRGVKESEHLRQGVDGTSSNRTIHNRRNARAGDDESLTWFTYRGWLLLLTTSILSTALISILITFLIVREPGIEAKYRDALRRLDEARSEADELRANTQRLESELKTQRSALAEPTSKLPAAKEASKPDRDKVPADRQHR